MEEGADNSNLFIGGSSGTPGSDVIPEEGRIAGFDFLDPRKPGYLARMRFKPSRRPLTCPPRTASGRYSRTLWPRFSSLRRYIPVSVLTVIVYVFVLRIMMLLWGLLFNETMFARFWCSRAMFGMSMLGLFEVLNIVFAVWMALDFFVATRDRRRPGLGQKVGYVGALILLGALQFAYNRLDYANDYLHVLTIQDDLAHPSLMLRIPPKAKPDANQAMTFEQCQVCLALLNEDSEWGYIYSFFEWESQGLGRFKRPGDPNLVPALGVAAEMRSRATKANPPWLLIDPTQCSDLSWRELVKLCDLAFDAGFKRVFLRDSTRRSQFWGGSRPPSPNYKSGLFYCVAEVLTVEPTRWRQGTGRENRGTGLVRVLAPAEGEWPWALEKQEYELYFLPRTHERVGWYCMDHEGELSDWGSFNKVDERSKEMIAREVRWRRDHGQCDLALWIWANGQVRYSGIAPLVDQVSQKRWDANRP